LYTFSSDLKSLEVSVAIKGKHGASTQSVEHFGKATLRHFNLNANQLPIDKKERTYPTSSAVHVSGTGCTMCVWQCAKIATHLEEDVVVEVAVAVAVG